MEFNQDINKYTFVAFDTETSGAYPVGYDIVEFGAIKWQNGKEVAKMQRLYKPREPMSDFIISIHGIKNEDVALAANIQSEIKEIYDFFKDSIVMAHHAPFDMGFIAYEFEKAQLPWPKDPVICTSLLSRKVITGTGNHKLQTLVKHFGIDGGAAHRAYDDAKSCLMVALECFKKMQTECSLTLEQVLSTQEKKLYWTDYALLTSRNKIIEKLVSIILNKNDSEIRYEGGSQKGNLRTIKPLGIIRNPDGDYVQAYCYKDKTNKRYYIDKISEIV